MRGITATVQLMHLCLMSVLRKRWRRRESRISVEDGSAEGERGWSDFRSYGFFVLLARSLCTVLLMQEQA